MGKKDEEPSGCCGRQASKRGALSRLGEQFLPDRMLGTHLRHRKQKTSQYDHRQTQSQVEGGMRDGVESYLDEYEAEIE